MMYASAFCGQMRCGKGEAADYLCRRLNDLGHLSEWRRGSFARRVKEVFGQYFGFSMEEIEYWKVRDEPPPGLDIPLRNGLTVIGDGWRNIRQDIWIKELFDGNEDNLVLDDCRYVNEVDAVRGRSNLPYMRGRAGIAVLCWRPGYENNKPTKSEQELMPFVRALRDQPDGVVTDPDVPFDLWLRNDGTVADWQGKVDEFVIPYLVERFRV